MGGRAAHQYRLFVFWGNLRVPFFERFRTESRTQEKSGRLHGFVYDDVQFGAHAQFEDRDGNRVEFRLHGQLGIYGRFRIIRLRAYGLCDEVDG